MKDPVAFNPLKYVFLFHGLHSMKHSLSKQYWDYSEVAGKVFPNVIKGKKKGGGANLKFWKKKWELKEKSWRCRLPEWSSFLILYLVTQYFRWFTFCLFTLK